MAGASDAASGFVPHVIGEPLSDVEATLASNRMGHRRRLPMLYVMLGVQAVCAFFFLGELWTEILGLRRTPIPYEYQEIIQIMASFGLVIGVVVGAFLVRSSLKRVEELNRQIDLATGNYKSHLQDLFEAWRLSPSEQEVTIYAMKGFSNAEIAELRSTAATTVKSQMNSVYRKSGLANRQQLITFLVEELLSGILSDPAAMHASRKADAQAA